MAFLYREIIGPWTVKEKPAGYFFERASLIAWALTLNIWLLSYDINIVEFPKLIIEDLSSKKDGYIYTYQTLFSAVLAFIAAVLAYKYNQYSKDEKSFLVAIHVYSRMARTTGILSVLAEDAERRQNNLIYYLRAKEEIILSEGFFEKIQLSNLSPKIGWYLSSMHSALNYLNDDLKTISNQEDGESSLENETLLYDSISFNSYDFLKNYQNLGKYIKRHRHKYPADV